MKAATGVLSGTSGIDGVAVAPAAGTGACVGTGVVSPPLSLFATSRSVRSSASSDGSIAGIPGSRSWSSDRISTCLIESIPSPASISMSRSSISTG